MKKRISIKPKGKFPSTISEASLIEALRSGGFITPKTDEEARQCLDRFSDSSTTLPPALQDADAAVSRILGERINLPDQLQNKPETEQAHSLRRAARKGDKITPEIEEAMRKAREAKNSE